MIALCNVAIVLACLASRGYGRRIGTRSSFDGKIADEPEGSDGPKVRIPTSTVSPSATRRGRVLVDCSHEFLFRPPYFEFLEQCGYEVQTTNVGLRPNILFAYDACVIWSGSMEFTAEELVALKQFVERGGGVVLAGVARNVQSAARMLGLPSAPECFDPAALCEDFPRVAALESLDAKSQDPAKLCQLFERLTARRAGDESLFAQLHEARQDELDAGFCTIAFPDSFAGKLAEEFGASAREIYELVAEQFGYRNTEEKMHITALLCCGSGWQASKYCVGIGCLGPETAVQTVLMHEFSNSLCVELTSMGGDAGWSTYVQDKVKRKLGWVGYDKDVEQIHDEAVQTYMAYEAVHGVVDPSSEYAYAHGANEAIIAKWKAIYTFYEMTYGDTIMHKYFRYAKQCAKFLIADGWDCIHDRMIVYLSLATGEDQTGYFERMGYTPQRRWSEEIDKLQQGVVCSPWGCSGNERPSGIPEEHPLSTLASLSGNKPSWAAGYEFDALGFQLILVRETGPYQLEVAGAAGHGGGNGAVLTVRASLQAGATLRVLVGQQATASNLGGGGATVVWLDGELLMVAGGGGTLDACLSENGGDARDQRGTLIAHSGGRNGHGGRGFIVQGGQGGAGLLSPALDDPEGPNALSEGGSGGHRWDPQFQEHKYGGWGGGGAEWYGGGGGGGYSGGGGCPPYGQSGGGGSWIASCVEEVSRQACNGGAGYMRIQLENIS